MNTLSLAGTEEAIKMKLISFAIPCFNSQAYMSRAIESILTGGDEVEIIIVNDGSKDETSKLDMNMKQNTRIS